MKVRVLYVDDEFRLCQAWEKIFAALTDFELVGTLPRMDDVKDAVAKLAPDIVVVDLSMPGVDPLRAIRDLGSAHPTVKVAVYSGHNDAESMTAAFDAGAWGYIDKLTPPQQLLTVLRRIANGEVVFPPQLMES